MNNILNLNFHKWFGNSKIKNNNKPLIVYHGSNHNIEEFDINKISSNSGNYGHYGYGFYFSTDKSEAKTYGNVLLECYIKMLNPFTGSEKQIKELKKLNVGVIDDLVYKAIDFKSFKSLFKNNKPVFDLLSELEKLSKNKSWSDIYSLFWKLQSNYEIQLGNIDLNDFTDILEYTDLNKDLIDSPGEIPSFVLDSLNQLKIKPKFIESFSVEQSLHYITDLGNLSKEVTDAIIKLGYDGVWYGSELVVFNPNQIKSINNNGDFSLKSNNIYE